MKNFLDFAKLRRFISENRAKNLEMLDESKQKRKRKELIQNYSDKEIQTLLTYKFDKTEYQKIFILYEVLLHKKLPLYIPINYILFKKFWDMQKIITNM